MKKFLKISLLLLVAVFLLNGCKNDNKGKDSSSTITIQIGYANNPGEPFDLGVHEWKRLLEEKSNGTMTLEIFPSSQLGNKNDLIDQMLLGDAIITLADGAFYADRGVADFGIVFGPYLFETWDDCWALTRSTWYAEQSKKLEEKGLKIITSNWIYGDRHTLTDKPVKHPSDFKGMKIRVPDNTIQIKTFTAMGATPTPMPLGEVYTALQTGVINGLENPLPVLYNGKFHEVAKYLTLDAHVKNYTTLLTGTKFFSTLTPEQQKLLIETGNEAGVFNNTLQIKSAEETLGKLKSEGVTVFTVDNAEFKKAAEKFYSMPEITSKWSPDLYNTVKKAIQEGKNK